MRNSGTTSRAVRSALERWLRPFDRRDKRAPAPKPRPKSNKEHQRAIKRSTGGPTFGLDRDGIRFDRHFEVYFAPEPLEREDPVLFFQHIRKTAGTSLRQVIHRNYTQLHAARFVVYGAPNTYDPELSREWCVRFLDALGPEERRSITCVVSHSANHLMALLDRPADAITMLRDPVDRITSNYHFTTQERQFAFEDLYSSERLENGRPARARITNFNGQSRSLLEPLFGVEIPELGWDRGAPPNASIWRDRLFDVLRKTYTVGLQVRFAESVSYFAERFGWGEVFIPSAKVNNDRPREVVDPDMRAEIEAYNWLDVEMYEHFSRAPIGADPSPG
jgi:hypothetical protein